MQFFFDHKVMSIIFIIILVILLVGFSNFMIVKFSGTAVPAPEIPRNRVTIGSGKRLNYLVFGDSTSISQGGDYSKGYVVGSAEFLSENYEVSYQNYGVSGAVTADVLNDQLPSSEEFVPDLVLVAIGANDVTHLTGLNSVEKNIINIIAKLRERNPEVKIVLTGSASMGDIKRFPQPTKWLLGVRTRQINNVFKKVSSDTGSTFAYIARETGPQFAANQDTFFAEDNFHPNNKGYAVWTPVINDAIEIALTPSQPE